MLFIFSHLSFKKNDSILIPWLMWTVKVHASNKKTVMLHIIITNDFIKLEISTKDFAIIKKEENFSFEHCAL